MVEASSSHGSYGKRYQLGVTGIDLLLFMLGGLFNLFAYQSLQPILVAFMFYVVGAGVLLQTRLGGLYERRIFTRVFAVGFVMAGVAAVYGNVLGRIEMDALYFFESASGRGGRLTLEELQVITEGSLAIVIWRAVYDSLAAFGFARERYVGVSVNIMAVAFTGVIALKMARQVYGQDPYRFQRLTLLFAACGLFWLFAGIHVRDAIILLAVTALSYAWVHLLAKPDLRTGLFQIIIASLLAFSLFAFLRVEFVFVPIGMALAGVAALMLGSKARGNRLVVYGLLLSGLVATSVLLVTFGDAIQLALIVENERYLAAALGRSGSDSLGMALIVSQPTPVRLVLGSIYLFVFPVPFWSGFQAESAYNLFKSLNVLFFYFVMPLLGLAIWQLWKNKHQRTAPLLFVLFLSLGFTVAVAGTSLETRHFGNFLASLFVLALLPDLRTRSVRRDYSRFTFVVLSGVVAGHVLWMVLKS